MPTLPTAVHETVSDVVTRAKTAFLVGALSLPPRAQRALAGKPVRIEGNELALQAQLLLRLQTIAREPATETLPMPQGRAAMRRQAVMAGGRQPIGEVHERTVAGADGELAARLYVPQALVGSGPGPLAVFFHGGGMVRGDLESHDALCRFLAEEAGVRVLAVDYRLAPEHPFPAAVDDAWAAYAWVSDHAADYDADPARLAVAGDSAEPTSPRRPLSAPRRRAGRWPSSC
jgi:acetyl esterase